MCVCNVRSLTTHTHTHTCMPSQTLACKVKVCHHTRVARVDTRCTRRQTLTVMLGARTLLHSFRCIRTMTSFSGARDARACIRTARETDGRVLVACACECVLIEHNTQRSRRTSPGVLSAMMMSNADTKNTIMLRVWHNNRHTPVVCTIQVDGVEQTRGPTPHTHMHSSNADGIMNAVLFAHLHSFH